TAAGDTFIGYYLAGRVDGKSPVECLSQACAAAAICVTRPGAMDSIPSMREVRAFMERNKKETARR
ncbi:MAG: PfkB family carbohydrate kinase, partial [Kiritimatiellota bacterium]|nr:PfkB family carbohydrate kinase [Kiritimatiellota bacterium]